MWTAGWYGPSTSKAEHGLTSDQIMWNIVVGMAGLPATVVPVGRTAAGLPVGAQVVGRRHADALTIAVAGVVGALSGGYAVPPGFA